jgi:hypothetical protein
MDIDIYIYIWAFNANKTMSLPFSLLVLLVGVSNLTFNNISDIS